MLTLNDFTYDLSKNRIAQKPAEPRDSSKLLVLNRAENTIKHEVFHNLPSLLPPDTVIIRNNTRVIPARLFGKKKSGGAVELLLTKHIETFPDGDVWEVLTKPGIPVGMDIRFEHGLTAVCEKILDYTRQVRFNKSGPELLVSLYSEGFTPLPPYIHQDLSKEQIIRKQYQTLYAKQEGSSAAPTAGFHFTAEVDAALQAKGIPIEELTLHVGLGIFLPVKENDITKHHMHREWFTLSPDVAERINKYKKDGKKIIAVGTTTVRVLESCTDAQGTLHAKTGETDIFIYPPYPFRIVDKLITNFHMPNSTLLMLVGAFCSMPNAPYPFTTFAKNLLGKAYEDALKNDYRFFSFGDAMLIE